VWILSAGADSGEQFFFRILPGNVRTLGRAAGAEFQVDAALVSRIHCRLTAGATNLEVVDLDSTNGTFVNGARVSRALLNEGDRLGIGRVEFLISRASGSPDS
jgi:pSer/pThr/pTyr-binding forkhead associated (FHA) protein